jgi:guanylate cyclase
MLSVCLGEDPQIVLQQVCDPMINKRPSIPESCPPKVSTIYNECVNAEPDHRPTFEEVDVRLKRLDVDAVEPGLSMISMQVSKQTAAKKNERLLLEVFPQKIADALRDGRKIEPEHHECVTVFFSDIVGFTNISATLSPIKVSDMLDRLYLKFDALSREYDVFKIETIGDVSCTHFTFCLVVFSVHLLITYVLSS